MRFIDTFLLLCLLTPSQPDSVRESQLLAQNQNKVVERGRQGGLSLNLPTGEAITLNDWAVSLFEAMAPVSRALDQAHDNDLFSSAVDAELDKIKDARLTPSAKVLTDMTDGGQPFFHFAMNRARSIRTAFSANPIAPSEMESWRQQAQRSIEDQQVLEDQTTQSFAEFLEGYLAIES